MYKAPENMNVDSNCLNVDFRRRGLRAPKGKPKHDVFSNPTTIEDFKFVFLPNRKWVFAVGGKENKPKMDYWHVFDGNFGFSWWKVWIYRPRCMLHILASCDLFFSAHLTPIHSFHRRSKTVWTVNTDSLSWYLNNSYLVCRVQFNI